MQWSQAFSLVCEVALRYNLYFVGTNFFNEFHTTHKMCILEYITIPKIHGNYIM